MYPHYIYRKAIIFLKHTGLAGFKAAEYTSYRWMKDLHYHRWDSWEQLQIVCLPLDDKCRVTEFICHKTDYNCKTNWKPHTDRI